MFLKSLQIQGFKSFADKTKLEFHEGVTGIVGPNGCGKSNIVDSIRWVLGETSAKALRGGEMADVIFNGTDKRSALGLAEVQLTLSNCEGTLETEFNEVSIGRRVYRDGKGEYLINNASCRLRDIHELLMDTGIGRSSYSIMEQGKIDMLLSSKPEDRRAVFEEAAGITKFKTQKKEALRKLDYVDANLLRLADVVEEVERQMRSLERQAKKAKRYTVLHRDVRVLDLHYSHKLWREYRAEMAELQNSISSLRSQQSELETEIENRQEAVTEARDAYSKIEARLAEVQAEIVKRENTINESKSQIQFNAERAHELNVLINQHEADIDDTTIRIAEQEKEISESRARLASVTELIAEREQKLVAYETTAETSRNERKEIAGRLTEIRVQRNDLESLVAAREARIESGTRQLEGDQKRHAQLTGELTKFQKDYDIRTGEAERLRDEIGNQRSRISEQEETLAAAEVIDRKFRREHEEIQKEVGEFFKFNAEKTSRLEVLRQLVADGEGFEQGTQSVLRGLDEPKVFKKAVRGALANFIKVDKHYVAAVEAALGRNLQAIIVSDESSAEKIIGALTEGHLGEASLIAESESAGQAEGQQMELDIVPGRGALGWAADKVDAHKRVAGLVDHLLSNVLVVEDLATALRLRKEAPPGTAFATLAGEYLSVNGVMQGGSTGDEGGGSVLQRQTEIRALEKITRKLADDLNQLEEQRAKFQERVEKSEVTILEQRERLQKQQVNFSTLEGQLSLTTREVSQVENKIESTRWELDELSQRQQELEIEVTTAQSERDEASTTLAGLRVELDELKLKAEHAEAREQDAGNQLGDLRTALAVERNELEALQSREGPLATGIETLKIAHQRKGEEIDSYRERIERAEEKNREAEQAISIAEQEIAEFGGRLEGVRSERGSFTSSIESTEESLTEWRKSIQKYAEQRGREEIKLTQLELRLESLERGGRERYQTDLERFEPDSHALLSVIEAQRKGGQRPEPREEAQDFELEDPSEPDWGFVEEAVATMRARLDSMGPVNTDAIEEFEELEERHNFLEEQVTDLNNSKNELHRVITKINRDTRKMFAETFAAIKKNFKEMFKELFGERGKADLILMDENDPLESGIEVVAKPPGKKLQSITLLSGGERSMTAVALLFAIYMVKPSPFCVLDELDAPLDEANIGRFIKVLDRFIGDSQFIIVTHSKRTMSRADVMYGVSMEEFGVSKTVGVKFSDADSQTDKSKVAPVGG